MNKLVVSAILGSFAIAAPASASTLVGFYQFSSSSSLGTDSSGNGNNLTTNGTPAYTASGANGGGLLLDGSSYLSTAGEVLPEMFPHGGSSYTFSVDFKTTADGALGMIGWGNYEHDNEVNALRLASGGGIRSYWWGNDQDYPNSSPASDAFTTLADGKFHTVVANYDGATATRNMYVDGNLVASGAYSGLNAGTSNFALGRTYPGNSGYPAEYFVGTLDNVAVFNTALRPDEVSSALSGARLASAPGGVPEPATWAMMLIGFGMVGAGLRSRRKPSVRVTYA